MWAPTAAHTLHDASCLDRVLMQRHLSGRQGHSVVTSKSHGSAPHAVPQPQRCSKLSLTVVSCCYCYYCSVVTSKSHGSVPHAVPLLERCNKLSLAVVSYCYCSYCSVLASRYMGARLMLCPNCSVVTSCC